MTTGTSTAAGQSYVFTGTVTSVDPNLSDTFTTDMTLTGTLTFSDKSVGSLTGTDAHGFGDYGNVILDFAMVVGSYKAALAAGNSGGVQVVNNFPDSENGKDRFMVSSRLDGKQINGFAPLCFIALEDTGKEMLATTRLSDVGDLSRWTKLDGRAGSWYISFSDFGEQGSVTGVITSVTRARQGRSATAS